VFPLFSFSVTKINKCSFEKVQERLVVTQLLTKSFYLCANTSGAFPGSTLGLPTGTAEPSSALRSVHVRPAQPHNRTSWGHYSSSPSACQHGKDSQGHTFTGDSDLFHRSMNSGLTLCIGISVIHWAEAWKGHVNATGCLQYCLLQVDIFACLAGEKSLQNLTERDLITVTLLLVCIHTCTVPSGNLYLVKKHKTRGCKKWDCLMSTLPAKY